MAKIEVVEVPRREAPKFLAKAFEFFEQAETALKARAYDAAMLGAIHSAVSSADAVCVALSGRRAADPDHQRAADLLREVAGQSANSSLNQFRSLLAKKTLVEYESVRATSKDAGDAVKRAKGFVDWAGSLVKKARVG